MAIKTLKKAKQRKADEFYTMYEDIEKELINYSFDDKVVYCPCDNPNLSNFTKYFRDNFEKLGIKRLISTCYPQGIMEVVDDKGTRTFQLKEDGDFRSEECIRILKSCDVVVTNPPFSLFREFMRIVFENKKMFIVIGNLNAITYKDIFPYIKDNKMWIGHTFNKTLDFEVIDDYDYQYVDDEGKKYVKVPAISWFTNMGNRNREVMFETNVTFKEGNENGWYQKYDNYDAINVNKTCQIPMDYYGVMGVPITALDKLNHKEFEILGISQRGCHDDFPDIKKYDDYIELKPNGVPTGHTAHKINENPVLTKNDGKKNYYVHPIRGHIVQIMYQRIFIKRKLNKEKYE